MNITSKQRAKLRKMANNLRPTFQIGANELHPSNIKAIDQTFNNNELVKIKVNRQEKTDKEITNRIAHQLSEETKSQVVGVIGTTIILYRQHKDKDKRIEL